MPRVRRRRQTKIELPGHPLADCACCAAGLARSSGGGRHQGVPIALLRAGASALLTSAVKIYDEPAPPAPGIFPAPPGAAEFSRALHQALLHPDRPTVGEALMIARREIWQRYPNDPRHWATTMLWGNPAVRLPK